MASQGSEPPAVAGKQEANGKMSSGKGVPTPQVEAGKEHSSGEDSEATAHSTSDDNSPGAPRYGLRRKHSKHSKGTSPPGDGKEVKAEGDGYDKDDAVPTSNKNRRKRSQPSKQGDKQDGLLRLAQIAHASPRVSKKARGEKAAAIASASPPQGEETREGQAEHAEGDGQYILAPVEDLRESPAVSEPVAMQAAPPVEGGTVATAAAAEPLLEYEHKITPAQVRAWVTSGQPLNLPGFQPQLLPVVNMGARWQLDLRSGERLEDQPAPQMSLAMQGQMGGLALAQALGPRPPIFTGLNQAGQVPGSMNYVPPPGGYAGSLPIPSLAGQQGLPPGASPAGPYTALLGNQMQSLLPPGMIPGQYHPGFGHIPHPHLPPGSEADVQHNSGHQSKKRQRSSTASELADLPDIPLRRRGRPAGDGTTAVAAPHELQERRMQANRAAASRSHFRRKREMEMLDKDCATAEARIEELRASVTNLMAQEEQLRLQQVSLREHLASGCKAELNLETEPQALPPGPVDP